MSSAVKFVVYTAIFLLVGAVIYFFAFWQPNARRVEQLHIDINNAQAELALAVQRDEIHPQQRALVDRLHEELSHEQSNWERVSQEWNDNYGRFLPDTFDEEDIRQRIIRIINHYGDGLHLEFMYSQPIGVMRYNDNSQGGPPEGIWLTTIDIVFSATYDGFVSILSGFAHEGIDNRIISYNMYRQYDMWNVRLRLDVLTQTPNAHRYNGDYIVYSFDD